MTGIRCIVALAIAVVAGCGERGSHHDFSSTDREQAVGELASGTGKQLVDASNDFGFRLLRELVASDAKKNVFISPTSIATALDMTYNGVAGRTKAGMARALGIEGIALDDLNRGAKNLQTLWRNADPKVELTVANSLWGREGHRFRKDFLDRNARYYGAQLTSLDFNSPSAPNAINDWVSQHTNGKIPRIVDRIDPATVLYLIDAVYFKGEWQHKFKKEDTQSKAFHLANGETVQHPLMEEDGRFPYLRGRGLQAVALTYGKGKLAMYIFLPDEGSSIERFLKDLSAVNWRSWVTGMQVGEGSITIPRFGSDYNAELKDVLTSMGMGAAFQPSGDFEGMGGGTEFISEVRHKTYVKVDEEGTEAAAATEAHVAGAKPSGRFDFVADRPFFYAIVEHDTGAILFMGILRDPR
jgi:serpin B